MTERMGNNGGSHMDGVAAALSNLCVLHCVAWPMVAVMVAGAVSVHGMHGPAWLHWALLLFAVPVSLLALFRGFRSHNWHVPWLIAGAGFGLMVAGALVHLHPLETMLTVCGGLVIGVAHWFNSQRRKHRA